MCSLIIEFTAAMSTKKSEFVDKYHKKAPGMSPGNK